MDKMMITEPDWIIIYNTHHKPSVGMLYLYHYYGGVHPHRSMSHPVEQYQENLQYMAYVAAKLAIDGTIGVQKEPRRSKHAS